MTAEELLNAEDEHGPTHVANPDGHSNTAHAAHAAAKEMLDMWADWFNEGLSVEAFRSDMNDLVEYLRQWENAVVNHVEKVRGAARGE